MPDDVYAPPAFWFYHDDFLGGTTDFSTEEIGAYMLLICKAWSVGSVPNDLERLARIARVHSTVRMRKMWSLLSDKFEAHPTDPDRLIQPRLEQVRAEMKARSDSAKLRGSKGGNKRKQNRSSANSPALAEGVDGDSAPNSVLRKLSSSLRSEAPGGRKREPDVSWVEPLRTAVAALRGRPLASFTPDECVLAGRYHAWAFGNCTKTEANNKAKGVGIAGAFATMGRNAKYGDMTFGEYVAYARKVHEQREKTPFFDPWLIRAFVEFERSV